MKPGSGAEETLTSGRGRPRSSGAARGTAAAAGTVGGLAAAAVAGSRSGVLHAKAAATQNAETRIENGDVAVGGVRGRAELRRRRARGIRNVMLDAVSHRVQSFVE